MTLYWDEPLVSLLVYLYNMLPALLPLAPGLALAFGARRRIAKSAPGAGRSAGVMPHDGAEAARAILAAGGADGWRVARASGPLATFYDPSQREVRLSGAVFSGRSPEALGVATHEAGHALQDARGYRPLRFRTPAVLAARLGAGMAWLTVLASLLLIQPALGFRGAVLYSASALALLGLRAIERDANCRGLAALPPSWFADDRGDAEARFRRALEAASWADVAATLPVVGTWTTRPR